MTISTANTTRTALLACAWCGPLTVVVAFVGWLIAGVLPIPLGPSDSSAEVVAFFASGARVPMGIVLASIGVSLVIPLVAGIGYVMYRERGSHPLFALVQLVAGSVTCVCLILPMLIMATAGFRPERDAQITVALNDLAWLMFLTPIGPFVVQNIAIATSALSNSESLLPRWLGFLNLWVGFTFTFDVLAFAFHSGPFAWNGVLIFWLALTTYTIWLFAMGFVLRRIALDAGESIEAGA